MTPAELALELALDRAEAALTTAWLASPAATRLAAAARAAADGGVAVRGGVLARWALGACLAADPDVRAAAAAPHTLVGLAARHGALRVAATRLGWPSPRALVDAIHGAAPAAPDDGAAAADAADDDVPATIAAPPRLPDAAALVAALAAAHGLATAGVTLVPGATSSTVAVAPGHARATIGPTADALATLAVTLHEAGHALYRAQQAGMSPLAAAPPARWFDEAIAAWAVRALEDPTLVPDADVRHAAAVRRRRRERTTVRLAAFEAAVLDGAAVAAAWATIGKADPAAYPALFDEPGLMASYVAADRAALTPRPGELRAWARAGAALDVAPRQAPRSIG